MKEQERKTGERRMRENKGAVRRREERKAEERSKEERRGHERKGEDRREAEKRKGHKKGKESEGGDQDSTKASQITQAGGERGTSPPRCLSVHLSVLTQDRCGPPCRHCYYYWLQRP